MAGRRRDQIRQPRSHRSALPTVLPPPRIPPRFRRRPEIPWRGREGPSQRLPSAETAADTAAPASRDARTATPTRPPPQPCPACGGGSSRRNRVEGEFRITGLKMYRIGIDVGGTFTDLVAVDNTGLANLAKVPSIPEDPSVGVIDRLGLL